MGFSGNYTLGLKAFGKQTLSKPQASRALGPAHPSPAVPKVSLCSIKVLLSSGIKNKAPKRPSFTLAIYMLL